MDNESGNESESDKPREDECTKDVLAREFHRETYETLLSDPDVVNFRAAIYEAYKKKQNEHVVSGLLAKDNIHKIRMDKSGKELVVEFSATSLMAKYADALYYDCLEGTIRFEPNSQAIHNAKLSKGGGFGANILDCLFTWTPTDNYDHVNLCGQTDTFDLTIKIPQRPVSIALCPNPKAIHLTRKYVMPLCENTESANNGNSNEMCTIV